MAALRLLIHAPGAPGLRWFGLGPAARLTGAAKGLGVGHPIEILAQLADISL